MGQLRGIYGPSGYSSESLNCLAEGYVGCKVDHAMSKAIDKGLDIFMNDLDAWLNLRLQQVDKYYQQQFERTMTNWNSIKDYLEKLALKMSDEELQQRIVTR